MTTKLDRSSKQTLMRFVVSTPLLNPILLPKFHLYSRHSHTLINWNKICNHEKKMCFRHLRKRSEKCNNITHSIPSLNCLQIIVADTNRYFFAISRRSSVPCLLKWMARKLFLDWCRFSNKTLLRRVKNICHVDYIN